MRRVALVPLVLLVSACAPPWATDYVSPTPYASSSTATMTSTSAPSAPAKLRVKVMPWRLPSPIAREAVCCFGVDSTTGQGPWVTVAGGLLDGDVTTGTTYRLYLKSGRTTRLPDLAVPVHDTAGALNFVVGGGNASEQDVVQAPTRAGRWKVVGRLPQARSDLSLVTVGDSSPPYMIALGGYNGTRTAEPGILVWNGYGWDQIGQLPVPVRYAATAVIGNDVYVVGGERAGVMQTAIQRVDATTGKATIVSHLPGPLGHASAVALGGRILIVGGRTGVDTLTDQMWWFDPATAAVTQAGHLPFPLADSAVATAGGPAFLIGGETPRDTDKVLRLTFR